MAKLTLPWQSTRLKAAKRKHGKAERTWLSSRLTVVIMTMIINKTIDEYIVLPTLKERREKKSLFQ